MIRFLFKTCALLCLLFIALSFFLPGKKDGADNSGQSAGLFATAAAIGTFIADMDGFCGRHPQSCDTGKSLFGTMADKAQTGAGFAYQWLSASLHKGAENTEQHLKQTDEAKAGGNKAEADNSSIEALIAQAPPPAPAEAGPAPAAAPPKPASAPKQAVTEHKQARLPPPEKTEKVVFLNRPRPPDGQKAKPGKAETHKPAKNQEKRKAER